MVAQERTLDIISSSPQRLNDQSEFQQRDHPHPRYLTVLDLLLHISNSFSLGQPTNKSLVKNEQPNARQILWLDQVPLKPGNCQLPPVASGLSLASEPVWILFSVRGSQLLAQAPVTFLCCHSFVSRDLFLFVFILEIVTDWRMEGPSSIQLQPKESMGQKVNFPARQVCFRQTSESIRTG